MYLCWKNICLMDCMIWFASLRVIRGKVNEESSVEQFEACSRWIDKQTDAHWRKHLQEWLEYVSQNKHVQYKDHVKSKKVEATLKEFYDKIMK